MGIRSQQFRGAKTVMIIGIDLGTTYSVAAYMTSQGPQLIPNALGEVLTPSVIGIDLEGKLLVGRAAKELQVPHPDRCANVFKRRMGSDWTVTLAGRKFTPEELSSLVLQSIKQDAEVQLGQPVRRAVITVPAYFNEHQRKATIHAGEIAGLKVERIVNEPTAAAIAYGFHELEEEKVLLVFDLGGGTFDVSVVELFQGMIEVRSSSGDTFLGGEDFTATLAARVLESRGMVFERTELESPLLVSRLMRQCDVAKCRLSKEPEAQVRVPNAKGEIPEDSPELTVTREQFQAWTNHILSRVDLPIRRALGDAGLKPGDVHEVLLVGGATRMPAVVQRLVAQFGKEPQRRLNPDEVVALGAAVQAGLIAQDEAVEDLVVTDIAPFTLGVSISKRFGTEYHGGYFLPIIHRNTTLPVSRVHTLETVYPNQTEMVIGVYQGEHRRVEDNLLLGKFTVQGIPMGPSGQSVDIRFTYDLNGVLEVEATVVETQKKITHLITTHARGMTPEQITRAVEAMQALKTHPREDLKNRYLLRRAERVYCELPLLEQQILNELLTGFEEALELGEQEVIQRHFKALTEFIDKHDFNPEMDQGWEMDE
jgi:molecular chaperone HscC